MSCWPTVADGPAPTEPRHADLPRLVVLARAYLPDEPGHAEALALLEGDDVLVTGPLTWIEVTGLLVRAQKAGRIDGPIDEVLEVLDDDMGEDGAVTVVRPLDAVGVELMARCSCATTACERSRRCTSPRRSRCSPSW